MSILKYGNGKNRGSYSLRQAVDYILNPEKTSHELISGNGVDTDQAARDMETIQTLYGKNSGRAFIHWIISFDEGVSERDAYMIGKECAAYYAEDYQYIIAVHTNTDHIHVHVVLNAVNVHTGNKFSQSKRDMLRYREYVNEVLQEYGLPVIGKKLQKDLWCEQGTLQEDMYYEDILMNDVPEDYGGWWAKDNRKSFFGPIDEDECNAIEEAERVSNWQKRIIRYFEGEEAFLPPDISYDEAEMFYLQWSESQEYNEDF